MTICPSCGSHETWGSTVRGTDVVLAYIWKGLRTHIAKFHSGP